MFILPKLPYTFGALEPYIDALTMEIHHDKHHQAYIDNLNKALEGHADLQNKSLEYLLTNLGQLPESIRVAVRNNAGGDFNHTMFWPLMKKDGGGEPKGKVGQAIVKKFDHFDAFKEQFNVKAKSVFGSGWAWLCLDQKGDLLITSTANQDNPISMNLVPIMGLDVWEHAYYLKYQNRRPDYINAWWYVINWDQVEENYRKVN